MSYVKFDKVVSYKNEVFYVCIESIIKNYVDEIHIELSHNKLGDPLYSNTYYVPTNNSTRYTTAIKDACKDYFYRTKESEEARNLISMDERIGEDKATVKIEEIKITSEDIMNILKTVKANSYKIK